MRAATAAGLAAQSVALADPHLADPHLADADGAANHADPVTNNLHRDASSDITPASSDINPADPDTARTDNGTSHDQPLTDNDGQRHRGYHDPFSDCHCDGDSVRRHSGTDSHADVQRSRHANVG